MKRLTMLGLAVLLINCGADDTNPGPGTNPEPGTNPGSELIPQTYKISDCGGFELQTKADFAPAGYCDAEVLKWAYDATTGTLKLRDNRMLLNCCGDHKMTVTENNGVYEVLEVDAPEEGARCYCMCVFDFTVEAQSLAGGTIQVKLLRDVTDSGNGVEQIWSGQLDLSKGSGEVVLDTTDVGPLCQP